MPRAEWLNDLKLPGMFGRLPRPRMEQATSNKPEANAGCGLVERARKSVTSQLSTQKDRATDSLGDLAQAVRRSTQSFRDSQQDTVARYIESAAGQIEQFSSRLRERDVTDQIRDVQQFARRQPAVFIAAAFTVGLVSARFLKSSGTTSQYDGGRDGGVDEPNDSISRYEPTSRFERTGIAPRYAGGGL
ncbi:MAG: hypothetical protein ACRD15_17065 [Vicinamibacterales bacterium]